MRVKLRSSDKLIGSTRYVYGILVGEAFEKRKLEDQEGGKRIVVSKRIFA
jgi:hypothetical protein